MGFSDFCSVKNDVLHFGAAQGFAALLAEHPADGVGNIAFSAAVGTDNSRYSAAEFERCFFREGLEALHFNFF